MTLAMARYAGLVISPAAWAASTQLGQILPYGDCSSGALGTASMAFAAAAIALAASCLSWQQKNHVTSRTRRAMTYVATFSGFSFAFALILQGAATVLLSPCLH